MNTFEFEHEIAIVAILKNEEDYVKEWIDYHFTAGIKKFYLYDNESPNLKQVLKPYITDGIVEYTFFPGKAVQLVAYEDAVFRHMYDCRYMAFIDGDEFIYPKTGLSIPETVNTILSQDKSAIGISINWRMFGSSKQEKQTSIPVMERFTFRAKDEFVPNKHIKIIVNPRYVEHFIDPHHAQYDRGKYIIDEHGNRLPCSPFNERNTADMICINHYYIKSKEEWSKKRMRGRATCNAIRSMDEFQANDKNDIHDEGIVIYHNKNREYKRNETHNKSLGKGEKKSYYLTDKDFTDNNIEDILCYWNLYKKLSKNTKDDVNSFFVEQLQNSRAFGQKKEDWKLIVRALGYFYKEKFIIYENLKKEWDKIEFKKNLDNYDKEVSRMKFSEHFCNVIKELSSHKWALADRDIGRISYWFQHTKEYTKLYYLLEDEMSKDVFIRLLKFEMGMVMFGKSVYDELALYPPNIYERMCKEAEDVPHVSDDYVRDRVETFILEGYDYDICGACEGDIVLDCGAYTGNTAFFFSNKVGKNGKVYAFEAMPQTYEKLKRNIGLFPHKNTEAVNYAISDIRKDVFFSKNAVPGSAMIHDESGTPVHAISIDSFVEESGIQKVDFIKMDIEGEELAALNGSVKTCTKFHPKLAICVYHRYSDFIDIPRRILQINPNYRFYMKHNADNLYETVLFAYPAPTQRMVNISNLEIEYCRNMFTVWINLYIQKEGTLKRNFYRTCASILSKICIPYLEPVYSPDGGSWVYFPVTDDNRLHYEIKFYYVNQIRKIKVCLHFEGRWKPYAKLIDCKRLKQLQSKFEEMNETPFGYEMCYITCNENEDFVAKLMKYLIQETYFQLEENGLVSDKIRLSKL